MTQEIREGSIVTHRDGPQSGFMWGDHVTIKYFRVKAVDPDGTMEIYSHPFHFYGRPVEEYVYVADQDDLFQEVEDNFEDDVVPNADAQAWWDDLDDDQRENMTGPYWYEFV